MKKVFLAFAFLCSMGCSAQIETMSSYDTNTDGQVTIQDVTNVVNKLLDKTAVDYQVVTAENLNKQLVSLGSTLTDILRRLEYMENVKIITSSSDNSTSTDAQSISSTVSQIISQISAESQSYSTEELNTLLTSVNEKAADIQARLTLFQGDEDVEGSKYYYPWENNREFVDLGITDDDGNKIMWATTNVGAEKPEEGGLYFAWGETEGYTSNVSDGRLFNWAGYKWCSNSAGTAITKYRGSGTKNTTGNPAQLERLEASDDAASMNWGGTWRMPTEEELTKLKSECTWTWDNTNKGYTVTGSNGNSIFLPAAGYRNAATSGTVGTQGWYWSSDLSTNTSNQTAGYLKFTSSTQTLGYTTRTGGFSVRAVVTK